jgi:hypothetical protein
VSWQLLARNVGSHRNQKGESQQQVVVNAGELLL